MKDKLALLKILRLSHDSTSSTGSMLNNLCTDTQVTETRRLS